MRKSLGWESTFFLVSLCAAFPLPPKIVQKNIDWLRDLKELPVSKALQINKLSQSPNLTGSIDGDFNGDLSPELPPNGSLNLSDSPSKKIKLSHPKGSFEWVGTKFLFSPTKDVPSLWAIDFGVPLTRVGASSKWGITGWSLADNELFWIPPRLDIAYRVKWSSDAEIVRFFFCDPTLAVVVENLRNGLSRFSFLNRELKPVSYTLFDLSEASRKSDISGVEAMGTCENFKVTGSFGLSQIIYPRFH